MHLFLQPTTIKMIFIRVSYNFVDIPAKILFYEHSNNGVS
ncbi:hypothetical protein SAMN05443550_102196 [Pedobacter hartonius]|uniref:Uncharacterized protein n=1 Tax=Pedobacter hartonius TaxID=425514 RepID=A0A1H3Z140_9SPHI|nr:hypothetical protein SAMN05443550_102196 [Pedobacter hartonius]